MNRYFQDTRYYVKRAGETAKEKSADDTRYYVLQAGKTATKGIATELEPLGQRFRRATSEDEEEESSRLAAFQSNLEGLQKRAGSEATEAVETARERLDGIRKQRAN